MKKILLDENFPRQLKQSFSEHFSLLTVRELGWQSKKNGDLLRAMQEEKIQYLMTVDRNLQYQPNLDKFCISIILLLTFNNRLKTLLSHVTEIERVLLNIENNERVIVIDLRS